MSYILEALKKSDQQRQRGATPKLPTEQEAGVAVKHFSSVHYGVIAAVLLCAGVAIGWLRPWQETQPVNATEPTAGLPIADRAAPATPSDQSEMPRKSEQKISMPETAAVVQAAPQKADTSSFASTSTSAVMAVPVLAQKKHTSPADVSQEQKAIPFAELPMNLQQEIPAMAIQLHSYSSNPANSLVSINSRMLKEGDSLMPGLKLEQITQDGVILSYKGYRFQHGIW